MFPDKENVRDEIIRKIDAERVRLDIALWFLGDGDIVAAIIRAHQRLVPVRVIGDRVGIFEADRNTLDAFLYLANAGVPIRVRYEPTWFPEIIHWKSAIFVGQGLVEFGSGNWTTFELMPSPWSPTDFKDETLMFTDDPAIFRAFLTKFDQYWADTTGTFRDWPEVYKAETGQNWTVPMNINRARLEQDHPTNVPGMVWSQGPELLNQMIADINAETQAVDLVSYRMTVFNLTDALIAKHQSGVPVRVFIEPLQYRNAGYPEYWLVGAQADRLWAAGVPIKIRTHQGLTHMKAVITSRSALVASSNFTKFWQRDHNYFIPATSKPQLYLKYKDQFNKMWNDTANYTTFTPSHPEPAVLLGPASGAGGAALQPKLEWRRAPWAVFFDVRLGTSPSNMPVVGTVNAVMDESPPETYSFTPALQANTTYYWQVVSRSYATAKNPSLASSSELRSFTTGGSGGNPNPNPSGPFTGTPIALPGTIQAENFDNGANNVAYFDTTAGNSGGVYRTTDVDIAAADDVNGGYTIGWMAPAEWLAYTVNVATAGTYTLEFRVASLGAGGTFHLEVNGTNVTGPLVVPNTGGWQSWTTVTKTGVTLGAGNQVWRFVIDSAGSSGAVGNLNHIRVVSGGGTNPPPPTGNTPFGGTPTALPGTLQAENFDDGGAGVAYNDTTLGNSGGVYRSTDVDIEASSDAGGGFNLGWVKAGEWLKYTVNVSAAGTYTVEFRVAATSNGGTFHVEVDGVDKTGPMTIPATGGYQSWTTISKSGVTLSAGQQVWRLVIDSAGTVVGNLNYIRVVGGTPPSGPTPFTGTPIALPGRVEVENFDNGGTGVAYQDQDAGNNGGEYRSTDVDITGSGDTGGGYLVGWAGAGEWLKYSVNVANAGTYDIEIRVASAGTGGTFRIEFNGVDKTGPMTVPNTGGWGTWTTIRKNGVTLSAGPQQIRLVMDTNGSTGATGNFNWIRIALPGQ